MNEKHKWPIQAQRDVDRRRVPGLHPVTNTVGLFLKVARGGSASWVYRFTLGGKARDMGLGSAGDVKLDRAIKLAREARELRAQGIDPIAARDAKHEEQREAEVKKSNARTFKECSREFLAEHSGTWKNAKHRQQWFNSLENFVYPVIGHVLVQDVDVTAVLEVLRPLKDRPETAMRVRGRIEIVIDFATPQYRTGDNPATWKILKHKIRLVRDVEPHPAIDYHELPAFMADLRQRTSVSAEALQFLILTVGRTDEVIQAKWPEIKETDRLWILPPPRHKTGERVKATRRVKKEHRVLLSDPAMAVLERRKAERQGDQIFGLSNNALLKMLTIMGRGDITVHGMRAAFKTWATECTDFPREAVELSMAHVVGDKVEQAYQRGHLLEKRRKLMDAWAAFCLGEAPANVVPFKAA
jgi:integrase